ncbi:MAG: glycosyltransferase family 2 protein [Chloroflexi bacterium]|nr:glycosyltransferase family 2 protein [Chloroflexota bacterium]
MTAVDVVIPVYNEEADLPRKIPVLRDFLASGSFPYDWRIVIADNASTDGTPEVSRKLVEKMDVAYVRIPQKGRGRALKATWLDSQADIVSYMDVDLSTDLAAFPVLVRAIAEDGADVAVGRRLGPGAQVIGRTLKREVLSRGYNLLIRALFWTRFRDAQCGFKAASRAAVQKVVPLIENDNWFFDSELLILAEKMGLRIAEVPVRWCDDPDSRVKVAGTVWEDLRGLARLYRKRPWRQAA